MADKTIILTDRQIDQKIQRIAHQIHELVFSEKEIFVVGIEKNGVEFANRLTRVLGEISNVKINQCAIGIQKDKPSANEVRFDGDLSAIKNKTVFLVDDVINSGRTLIYAVQYL
ncbi:MAG: pyrimidine operon attenuation protein/uracil phosphoribosyltransferase, partial [Gammaproteobacteria bacterium]